LRRPVTVAVTGGIGAGKSEALRAFERHGAAVASSDAVVHRLLAEDPEVRAAVAERWGEAAVGDRAAIAAIVFRDRGELDWLERLLHPRVLRETAAWLEEQAARAEPPPLCVVEIPLLYETGGEARFDHVVVITAPSDVRAARGGVRDERERRLLDDEEKSRRADFAYANDGTLGELDAFVADVVGKLTA
jgi:dephospho-CoA kinase